MLIPLTEYRGCPSLSRYFSRGSDLKRANLVQLFDGERPQDLALVTLEGPKKGLVDLLLRLNEESTAIAARTVRRVVKITVPYMKYKAS